MSAWQGGLSDESLELQASASKEVIPHLENTACGSKKDGEINSMSWNAMDIAGLVMVEQGRLITVGIVVAARTSVSLIFQEEALLMSTTG